MSEARLLAQCESLDWQSLLRVFAQFMRDVPEQLDLPAKAIRNKARAGELPEDVIPLLTTSLMTTKNTTVIVELAKALAAFGRKAQVAAPILADKLRAMVVSDDADFWAFDGSLYAIAYLGGEHADTYLKELEEEQERMPPVLRSEDLYQGTIPFEDREGLFYDTLERVRGILESEDPGVWRQRRTDLETTQAAPSKALPAWLASVS